MKIIALHMGLIGLLLSGAGIAQERDASSPKVGNAQRGRVLLSILGPKPHDAAGISPLQQQELNRRVRCAATRQQIQDQLDFEAAGSSGFYPMAQLRAMEIETCIPVQPDPLLLPPPSQPVASYRPPPQRPALPQPIPLKPAPPQPALERVTTQQLLPQRSTLQQPPAQQPPAQQLQPQPPPQQLAKSIATAPAYTPVPDYPDAEKTAGHEGIVLVHFLFNADGSVESATVKQSSKFEALDAAALTAARTWRVPSAAGKTLDVPLIFSTH